MDGDILDVCMYVCGEILDLMKFEMYRVKDNIIHAVAWMVFVLFCCKICSVAIYGVLSRHLFCHDLRTFYMEKN